MTQLEVAPTRPPRFAVVSTWPTTENAEYEYIQRIRQAAQSIGAECLIIDEQGYILDIFDERIHENEHRLSFDDIDFVIYLHYFSPKLIDCYSYFALWNPAEFFVMHGYTEHTQRLAMHDDFLHIESPAINRHVTRALRQYDRWIEPSLILHTTCSGPILAPAGGNLSFFYCGINWERINGRPSRYDRLLRKLQETGLLAIFGPKEVQGKDVWSDFHCYRGPIPFDGTSIIYAINSCGISLVLNSLQHQLCAAQSNRLFESLAAGAIIVTHCDSELFEVFGDTLFYLDSVDQDRMFDEIMEHFRWIETHPDEAREKARLAQNIFLARFRLSHEIDTIFRNHAERVEAIGARKTRGDGTIEVIVNALGLTTEALPEIFANIGRQTYRDICVSLICGELQREILAALITVHVPWLGDRIRFYTFRPPLTKSALRREATGNLVHEALSTSMAEYFVFAGPGEHWFRNHLVELARSLRASGVPATHVGVIEEQETAHRRLLSVQLHDWAAFLTEGGGSMGLLGFRRDLVETTDQIVLADTDFLEPLYFLAKAGRYNEIAAAGKATVVLRNGQILESLPPIVRPVQQLHFFRDHLLDRSVPPHSMARALLDTLTAPNSRFADIQLMAPTFEPRPLVGFSHLRPNTERRQQLRTTVRAEAAGEAPRSFSVVRAIFRRLNRWRFKGVAAAKNRVVGFGFRNWLIRRRPIRIIQRSGLFVEKWYLAAYPDLDTGNVDPIEHYLKFGAAEGRNPSPFFDTKFYLAHSPDVRISGMNPLVHFILYGHIEGRKANAWYQPKNTLPNLDELRLATLTAAIRGGRTAETNAPESARED